MTDVAHRGEYDRGQDRDRAQDEVRTTLRPLNRTHRTIPAPRLRRDDTCNPPGREYSASNSVAEGTATAILQRGQLGELMHPVTPSRYVSGSLQCGHGPK